MSGPRLVVATSNPGKMAEFARLLPPTIVLVGLSEAGVQLPPEDGATFSENARAKAVAAATQSGLPALGDDSGLEVDALAGAPGIFSARFAGEPASDQRNRAKLLAALADVPNEARTARFVCVAALALPNGVWFERMGICRGAVALAPIGHHGFGYDPVFALPDGRTLAQLPPAEKDHLSHRGQAIRALLPDILAHVDRQSGAHRIAG